MRGVLGTGGKVALNDGGVQFARQKDEAQRDAVDDSGLELPGLRQRQSENCNVAISTSYSKQAGSDVLAFPMKNSLRSIQRLGTSNSAQNVCAKPDSP